MQTTRQGAIESAELFLGMWKALVTDYGAVAETRAGVAHRWADAAFGFFNALSFADPDVGHGEFTRRLDHAGAVLRASDKAGFFWLFEELLTDEARARLEESIARAGLVHALTCYGMAGDVLPLPESRHDDLRFERVSTQAHLDAYASLNARAYGMPGRPSTGPTCGVATSTPISASRTRRRSAARRPIRSRAGCSWRWSPPSRPITGAASEKP